MGKKDTAWKRFFSDNVRYADVINALGCGGEQVVKPGDLTEMDTASGEGGRDAVRKAAFGMSFMVIGIEDQEKINYAEALTVMDYDVVTYKKQANEIRKEIEGEDADAGKPSDAADPTGERFYGFRKDSRLHPTVTFVLYAGEAEWDAATSLHGLMDFSGIPEPLRRMTQDYKINVVEIRKLENMDIFKSDVRQVFEFVKCLRDKERLGELLSTDAYYSNVDRDTYEVMATYAGIKTMKKVKVKGHDEKEGYNMCNAFQEMYNDGLNEGRNEGIQEGMQKGMQAGREEGKVEAILGLVRDHLLSPSDGAKRLGMTESELASRMAKA